LKLSLTRLLSGFRSALGLNANFEAIETAFENTLSRDGTSPNSMSANIDMGGHRVTNLSAPVDPNDAVRLQDVVDGVVSVGGSSDWNDITNKPSEFPPAVHTSAKVSDFQEAAQDAVGALLVGGTNIALSYDDNANTLTINATAPPSGSVDWTAVANKPSTFTPSAHTHVIADTTGLQTALDGKAAASHSHTASNVSDFTEAVQDVVGGLLVAGSNVTLNYNDGANTLTISAAGGGGGSGGLPPSLDTFGTIDSGGVNTSANDAAFTAAEASSYSSIYIPDGLYATTLPHSSLTKAYVGRGVILQGGEALPAKFSWMVSKPSTWATQGAAGWFRGDQRFTDGGEYHVLGTGVREYDLTSRYFESNCIPHHAWMDINSGNSGLNAHLQSAASTGSKTLTLTGNAPSAWIGKQIAFISGLDGSQLQTTTVTGVSSNTITINDFPASNYAAGTALATGKRTWNGHTYVKINHAGGGDGYGHIVRIQNNYQPKASETHIFETATSGQYGGDHYFGYSGTYGTGWENAAHDNGNDVAYIAQVDTFVRDNDTGARAAVWYGTLFKSEGSKPADTAHVVSGKWRIGLDTSFADLSNFSSPGDNFNAAITMALGQRIVFNQSRTTTGRGGSTLYSNGFAGVKGDMFLESGNDGSDYIALRFNRTSGQDGRIRLRPTVVQINTQLQVALAINTATDISLGASGIIAFGSGSGYYLQRSGTFLYWYSGGVPYRIALVGYDL
jgi:hypothetical protein